ncbi:MAG: sigma-70 family RNA polymerase sigma factor [Candidatus Peribacteria bacterium]|nr:sigma-70 family RNA polymerase sigma factor [Candidatus Peribacteria bacterium]
MFKNNLKDFWKRKGDTPFSELNTQHQGEKADFSDTLESPEDMTVFLETEFTFEQIQQAMTQLDDGNQEILFLKFIEEKEYTEIAEILSISQESARQRCSRALKQLKQIILTS